MKRDTIRAVILVAVLLALVGCTARPNYPKATRTVPPSVPAYLNAQQLEVRRETGPTGEALQITTFRTTDPPEVVTQYYRDQLIAQGWEGGPLSFANTAVCPLYSLYLSTQQVGPQSTKVELRLVPERCIAAWAMMK